MAEKEKNDGATITKVDPGLFKLVTPDGRLMELSDVDEYIRQLDADEEEEETEDAKAPVTVHIHPPQEDE